MIHSQNIVLHSVVNWKGFRSIYVQISTKKMIFSVSKLIKIDTVFRKILNIKLKLQNLFSNI